ncbi:PDR/VanB family oxidoreductase [Hydrogenophaga sp. 2FB]|uniref:PDR/VanB family oxidoreductase n=1 Tax=Hydrogenophaga sp. 2FB TaxID=2502187 RepID=UPI0010F60BBC|nr:PDR/VanB family oxidoreductase [Hydrogenophaga sp. 2FB]
MEALLSLQVKAIREITPHIREFELGRLDGAPLPRFRAGAHLKFELPTANGGLQRCYSLINTVEQGHRYRIAVHRSAHSQGGSEHMWDQVCIGTLLTAHPPRNDFALAPDATHHLLLAGGIGITPILSMAHALDAAGQSFSLHYAARTPEHMAYAQAISDDVGDRAHLYCDGGDPAKGMPIAALLSTPRAGVHLYVCGPQAMIDAVVATAQAQGWASAQVHVERFSAPAPQAHDAGFVVRLARSGHTLEVAPNQSILDVILATGCDPLFDCRRGECGACAVNVLAGTPDHRDYALTREQRDSNQVMCICVSRCLGQELVLDI